MTGKTIIRAYAVCHAANAGKVAALRRLYDVYRSEFSVLAKTRFRDFLAGDARALSHLGSTKGASTSLSQSYYQGLLARVCETLKSHVGHLRNRSAHILESSSVKGSMREEVRFLCLAGLWTAKSASFVPGVLAVTDDFGHVVEVANVSKRGRPVSDAALILARGLLKRARREIRFPDVRNPRMLLDSRTGTLSAPRGTTFHRWLTVSTMDKGKRVALPMKIHGHAASAPGEFAKSMELGFRNGNLVLTLFKKSLPGDWGDFLTPRGETRDDETLALDWGMSTLLATSTGELLGRDWLKRISAYDRKLTELASRRQRLGLPVRSKRYDDLRRRIVGFVRSETGRILNGLVSRHPKLRTVIVERLSLFDASLSKRMNRLLRSVGFGTFRRKLHELATLRGFEVVETNAAFSSRECPCCGFVHEDNRKTQAGFECLLCGKKGHADALAASNLSGRPGKGMHPFLSKGEILSRLRKSFEDSVAGCGRRFRKRLETLAESGIAFGARRASPAVVPATAGSLNRVYRPCRVAA